MVHSADARGGLARSDLTATDHADIVAAKARLRAECQTRRTARRVRSSSDDHTELARHVMALVRGSADKHGPAPCVSAFWPIGDEIDVRPLLDDIHQTGWTVALPVVVGRDQPLLFRRWTRSSELAAGPMGTRQPRNDAPAVRPDILLVPLLAFDRRGYRLGYGGGYYDRTLASLGRDTVTAIGVGYAMQEVDRVPAAAYDQALDAIVTENGPVALTASATPARD